MRGSHHVIVQNRRVRFEFSVRRNVTIVRGDSATGKTTLMSLIEAYDRLGDASGVEVVCDRRCVAVNNANWDVVLASASSCIVFLDEDVSAAKTPEFARRVRESDNYYVIITREDLPNLPYSVDEIYGIHTSGKYADLRRTYNSFYRIYEPDEPRKLESIEAVITEDSNSGHQFIGAVRGDGIDVTSAHGKANVRKLLAKHKGKRVLVIADGAAFGPEMGDVHLFVEAHPEVAVYLPESFEWIILASGVVDGNRIRDILDHTEDFVESGEFFSWERFFTHLLVQETKDTYLHYTKAELNDAYLNRRVMKPVLVTMGRAGSLLRSPCHGDGSAGTRDEAEPL